MIVYNERWLSVRWDESLKAPWSEAKGYAESDEYRAGLTAILTLCQRKRPSRYLTDTRNMAPITQADQRWTNEEFFPQLLATGVRYMAIIIPKASIARLTVRQIMSKVNDVTLNTTHFDDIESARAWLRSV